VNKFVISGAKFLSEFRVPNILKIGSLWTQLFKKWKILEHSVEHLKQ